MQKGGAFGTRRENLPAYFHVSRILETWKGWSLQQLWWTHDGAQDLADRLSPPETPFTFLDYRFLGVGLVQVGAPDPLERAVCLVEYPYGVVR